MILNLCFLLFLFLTPVKNSEEESPEIWQQHGQYEVLTHVANLFPNANATAFISLGDGESKLSRLPYSQVASKTFKLGHQTDFVITFKKIAKEEVISDFTDFGLFEGRFEKDTEAVVIIGRDKDQPNRPTHRAVVFQSKVESETSKVYIFNSIWDGQKEPEALSFYGLYMRKNYDGSESESVTQLALDVPMSEGREVEMAPDTSLLIKGFYGHIGSITEFKTAEAVVSVGEFTTLSGVRSYLLAFGDFTDKSLTPPQMLLVGTVENSTVLLHTTSVTLIIVVMSSLLGILCI